MSTRYVTLKRYAAMSGYTENALRLKIARGVWIEGRQWRKAPDGHVMIDVEGVEKWVEGRLEPSKPARAA